MQQSHVSANELKLAETLIEASVAKRFDFSKYEDDYTERLTELINAKVEGKEIVALAGGRAGTGDQPDGCFAQERGPSQEPRRRPPGQAAQEDGGQPAPQRSRAAAAKILVTYAEYARNS